LGKFKEASEGLEASQHKFTHMGLLEVNNNQPIDLNKSSNV
jgi:hypothetical protein